MSDFYLEMMDIQQAEMYSVLVRPGNGNTLIDIRRNGTLPTIKVHGTGLTVAAGSVTCDDTSYPYNKPTHYYKNYALISSGAIGLLLNREKETAFASDTSPAQAGEGIVFIRAVAYNVTYSLIIDGNTVGSVTTPEADADDNTLSTSAVAAGLATTMPAGFTAEVNQYVISITKDDGTDFTLSIDDNRSSELAVAFTNTVQTLGSLPVIAPNGYVVEVESDPSTTIDNRWLRFKTFDDADFAEGAWQETVKPGIKYKLDADTMPLVIYRAAENVFFVGPADGAKEEVTVDDEKYEFTFPQWGQRTAGDEVSSPGA